MNEPIELEPVGVYYPTVFCAQISETGILGKSTKTQEKGISSIKR
jgi:hypothetical protein